MAGLLQKIIDWFTHYDLRDVRAAVDSLDKKVRDLMITNQQVQAEVAKLTTAVAEVKRDAEALVLRIDQLEAALRDGVQESTFADLAAIRVGLESLASRLPDPTPAPPPPPPVEPAA
jgi:chromosome segregation ATPase